MMLAAVPVPSSSSSSSSSSSITPLLLRLPGELLHSIVCNLLPDDFESLLLSCKHIYNANAHLIPRHNELGRVFSNLIVRGPMYCDEKLASDLVEIVLALVAWPELGGYVRSLTIALDQIEEDENGLLPRFIAPGLAWIWDKALTTMVTWSPRQTAQLVLDTFDSPWLDAAGIHKRYWISRVHQFRMSIFLAHGSDGLVQREVLHFERGRLVELNDEVIMAQSRSNSPTQQTAVCQLTVLLLLRLPQLRTLAIDTWIDLDQDLGGIARVWQLMSARIGARQLPAAELAGSASEGMWEDQEHDAENDTATPDDWRHVQPGNVEHYFEFQASELDKPPPSTTAMLRATSHLVSPLENLCEVRYIWPKIPPQFEDRPYPTRLPQLDPLVGSPRLRKLHAVGMVAERDGVLFGVDEEPGPWSSQGLLSAVRANSSVEELHLMSCLLDPAAIAELVSHMPHLTALRYSHFQCSFSPDEPGWDVVRFLGAVTRARPTSAVRERLGLQITDLAVGIDCSELGGAETGLWSLAELEVLERLEIDAALFLGPHPDSGERRIDEITTTGPREGSGFEKWHVGRESDVPRLVDVLPSSLQELDLYVNPPIRYDEYYEAEEDPTARGWEALLRGMKEERGDKLPNLKRFAVHVRLHGPKPDFVVADPSEDIQKKSQELRRLLEGAGAEHVDGKGERLWQLRADEYIASWRP